MQELARRIYDDGVAALYAGTMSTNAKEVTIEQAREELKNNRLEAIRALNKKIKAREPEQKPETQRKPIKKKRKRKKKKTSSK